MQLEICLLPSSRSLPVAVSIFVFDITVYFGRLSLCFIWHWSWCGFGASFALYSSRALSTNGGAAEAPRSTRYSWNGFELIRPFMPALATICEGSRYL